MSLYKKADGSVSLSALNRESLWTVARSNRTKNSTRRMKLSALSPYTLYGISVSAVNVMKEVALQGNETKLIYFTTKDEGNCNYTACYQILLYTVRLVFFLYTAPLAPSRCTVDHKSSTFIHIVWQSPVPFDYRVAFYDVSQ